MTKEDWNRRRVEAKATIAARKSAGEAPKSRGPNLVQSLVARIVQGDRAARHELKRRTGMDDNAIGALLLSARGAGKLEVGKDLANVLAAIGLAQRGLRGDITRPNALTRYRKGAIF